MLRNDLQTKELIKASRVLLAASLLVALPVFAATGSSGTSSNVQSLTAGTLLQNLADQIPYLTKMLTAIAYVTGMYLVIMGTIQLKHFGESRTMMSREHGLTGPIAYLVTGAALLYVPTSVQVGMSTFWTNPNPYGYNEGPDNQWTTFINDCYLIVQLVGTIAFIRGLIVLSTIGSSQHGTFAKGMTLLVGGVLCINIYQFVQVILVTLGIEPS